MILFLDILFAILPRPPPKAHLILRLLFEIEVLHSFKDVSHILTQSPNIVNMKREHMFQKRF